MSAPRPAAAGVKKEMSVDDVSIFLTNIMKPVYAGDFFPASSVTALRAFEKTERTRITALKSDAKHAGLLDAQMKSYADFITDLVSARENLNNLKSKVSIDTLNALNEYFDGQIFMLQHDSQAKADSKTALQNFSKELNKWVVMGARTWPLNSGTLSDELSNMVKRVQDAKFVPEQSKLDDLAKLKAYVQIYILNSGHKHAAATLSKLSPGIQTAIKSGTGIKGSRTFSDKETGDQIFAFIGSHVGLKDIVAELKAGIINGNYNQNKDRFVFAMKALARIKPEVAYEILHPDKDAKQMPNGKALLDEVNHTVAEKFYAAQQAAKTAAPAPHAAAKK